MGEGEELQEVPFDMSKETLKSIRIWIDKITELSVGVIGGQKIDINNIITLKYDMVRQLIVLSAPLLDSDLEEIEEFFSKIVIKIGTTHVNSIWKRNVPVYSKEIDYKLDECVIGIEESLKRYFKPVFNKGENING